MAKIVILGAGLAGISTAYHLELQGIHDYVLFEQSDSLGGLCGSIQEDGFTFDYTGHLLHISDPYFQKLVDDVVGFDSFNLIERKSYVYSHDRYTKFPFQINLKGLPIKTISECINGYVKRHRHIKNPKNFKEWVLKQFGPGFARHFFSPYQEKIFDCNLKEITASWTGRFVPETSLEKIVAGAIEEDETEPVGYNAQFLYPKQGGILFWVQKFAQTLRNEILYKHKAISIDMVQKFVGFANGHVQTYDILINTTPLDLFLKMQRTYPANVLESAADNLRCNSVINFNFGIKRSDLSEKHWIYFPEKTFPFYRIGFGHNFAKSMAPKGCSSLYGEFAYLQRSKHWVEKTLEQALQKTKELFELRDDEILVEKIIPISHAYVIYDHWRERNIKKIHTILHKHNVHSIGRYGAWKYCSMQETTLDGKEVVNAIVN